MSRGADSGFRAGYPGSNPPGGAVTSVNTRTGAVVLAKADVGLGSVDNTADSVKVVASAAKWTTARTLTLTGDVAYTSPAMDGTGNVTAAATLAASGVTPGSYGSATQSPVFTVDAKGRVTVAGLATIAIPQSAVTGLTTALGAKADLVGGVIPTSQLPALAISDTFVVASQAAMLALTAERGDFAVRSDLTPAQVFILAADPASTLGNWVNVTTSANVVSVAGQTGVVVLAKGDVGLGNVDNTSDVNKPVSTAQATAIGLKATDTLVLHLAGIETITGPKKFSVPQTWTASATPATPAAGDLIPFFAADGLPYFLNPAGVVVPFSIGDVQAALHSNADFETISGGVPTIWGIFWQQGATFASITTDVVAGTKAASITWAAAAGNHQILESDVFTVVPGDTVTVAIYSKKSVGSPTLSIQFLSKVSGTPDYFDAATELQPGPTQSLTGSQAKYTQSFTVPTGHTVARLGYSYSPAASEACTIQVDNSTSARTGSNASPTLPGNSWVKEACRFAQVTAVTLAGGAPSTVDSGSVALNDRIFYMPGTAAAGIYIVTVVGTGVNGTWVRAPDAATSAQLAGAQVAVTSGTLYKGSRWNTTFAATDTIGTTVMGWFPADPSRYAAGYRSTTTAQSIATGTFTALGLTGTAAYDRGGLSIASSIVTLPAAGVYDMRANILWNNFAGVVQRSLKIETWTGSDPGVGLATIVAEQDGSLNGFQGLSCAGCASAVAGQKVRVSVFQATGGALTVLNSSMISALDIRLI